MTHKTDIKYDVPETDAMTVKESVAMSYNSIDSLKLLCLEKIMQLNDNAALVNIVHLLNKLTATSNRSYDDYTLDELYQRVDTAYAELEAGGGTDGESFFEVLKKNMMSR